MEWLSYVYLTYMFISLYFLSFFFLLYLKNRKYMFKFSVSTKNPSVSVIIPAYNAGKTIENTVNAIFDSDYSNILEVIVVNDCSKDNTKEVVENLQKKYPKLKLINNSKNLGNAAKAQNVGLKIAQGEIIAITDDDSYPAKEAIRKMIGFFESEKVGAVTCPVLARNKDTFFEKLQAIEYNVIVIARKLLEYVDAIYVTPGPLGLYRKKALAEIGGFDEKNMTQDIEASWHLAVKGWERKMCLDTNVTTTVPSRFKDWFRQRQRWNIGGMQTIWKHKKEIKSRNIVGLFILPLFVLSSFLGLAGLSIFTYLIVNRVITEYLRIKFSFIADTAVVTLNQFYFTPSVLNYLGLVLFILGAIYTFGILFLMKEDLLNKRNIFNILFYMLIYLSVYPFVMVTAIWRLLKKDLKW
ncbi:MAG: glycosyltransferase [Nanoarchaeota archaeon]